MPLALFDLDNTLLGGDSDYLWGRFMVERGLVDGDEYERRNRAYYEDYTQGRLDIDDFLRFALAPLTRHSAQELESWRDDFLHEKIRPIVLPAARALIERHRQAGDRLLIVTATHRFITEPIARLLGVPDLIATDPEKIDGRYTGRVAGIPCFQGGKVIRLEQWLAEQGETLEDSHFYSDSRNDLPLLEKVAHPVAVDPDEALREIALARGWPVVSLRG